MIFKYTLGNLSLVTGKRVYNYVTSRYYNSLQNNKQSIIEEAKNKTVLQIL